VDFPVQAGLLFVSDVNSDGIKTKTALTVGCREMAEKAVVMKTIIKNQEERIIATAQKKETEIGFPDYIEKAETEAIGRALAMCGYGTLQAPEFDEGERLSDSPIEITPKSS
jgi:hypothetical protein